jgi:hypothetical protein
MRRIFALLCTAALFFAHFHAAAQLTPLQRLASPDFSQFARSEHLANAEFIPDFANNRVYFQSGYSYVNGIPVSGLFRTDMLGNVDLGWMPSGGRRLPSSQQTLLVLDPRERLLVLPDGDLLGKWGNALLRISSKTPEVVATYQLPAPTSLAAQVTLVDFALMSGAVYIGVSETNSPNGAASAITTAKIYRLNLATGVIDANPVRTGDFGLSFYAASGGALFTAKFQAETAASGRRFDVQRINVEGTAGTDWTYGVGDLALDTIQVDSLGRVYAAYSYSSTRRVEVVRLLPDGRPDPTWSISDAAAALPSSVAGFQGFGMVDGLLVALASHAPTATTPLMQTLVVFGSDGRPRSISQLPIGGADSWRQLSVVDNQAMMLEKNTWSVVDIRNAEALARSRPIELGSPAYGVDFREVGGGRSVVSGNFTTWFDGVPFRGFVVFDERGVPIQGLSLPNSVSQSSARFLGETTGGELVFLAEPGAPSVTHQLVIADPLVRSVRVIAVSPPNNLGIAALALGSDDFAYFRLLGAVGEVRIRRAALSNGAVDVSWSLDAAAVGQMGNSLEIDATGGLWVPIQYFSSLPAPPATLGYLRYQSGDPSAQAQAFGRAVGPDGCLATSVTFSKSHAYVCGDRYRLGAILERDSSWNPTASSRYPPFAAGDDYVYFGLFAAPGIILQRARTAGNGAADLDWSRTLPVVFSTRPTYSLLRGRVAASGMLDASQAANPTLALYADVNDAPTSKSVVEYQVKGQDRYFISGREGEKALLDGRADLFVRTGASFMLADGMFRENDIEPVCRFYAPPRGTGKSSHFFGTGRDCQILNYVSGFAYEGIDFGTVKPTNGVCPSSYPAPVTRLFNNRVATTLEGNHRYVADATTKARMLARGWVDEGVVFCASSALAPNT